jgi:hypothetical protein
MKELHRQQISGEELAGYWYWLGSRDADHWTFLRQGVSFEEGHIYKYEPSPNHPHFKIYNEWTYATGDGSFDRGELELFSAHGNHISEPGWRPSRWNLTTNPSWKPEVMYEIRKSATHPDNLKTPSLTPIDWRDVPVSTNTSHGTVVYKDTGGFSTLTTEGQQFFWDYHSPAISILPATKWTALETDHAPPVFAGLAIEYRYWASNINKHDVTIYADGASINAYRVVGIADGYTDDPSKVGGV